MFGINTLREKLNEVISIVNDLKETVDAQEIKMWELRHPPIYEKGYEKCGYKVISHEIEEDKYLWPHIYWRYELFDSNTNCKMILNEIGVRDLYVQLSKKEPDTTSK